MNRSSGCVRAVLKSDTIGKRYVIKNSAQTSRDKIVPDSRDRTHANVNTLAIQHHQLPHQQQQQQRRTIRDRVNIEAFEDAAGRAGRIIIANERAFALGARNSPLSECIFVVCVLDDRPCV